MKTKIMMYDELISLIERLRSKDGEYYRLTCLFNAIRWSRDSENPYGCFEGKKQYWGR